MYTDRLADYAAAFRYEQLPAEAVAAAKVILLDTLGAMLLGSLPMYAGGRLTAELARSLGGRPEPPPASGYPAPKAYTIYDAFTGAMHRDELTRDLGEVFWITRHSGFKPYPCCGGGAIHTAIAARTT